MNIPDHYATALGIPVATFLANAHILQTSKTAATVLAWNEAVLTIPPPSDADLAAVLALPEPPMPLPQLVAQLVAAALAASSSITKQIASTETHLAGYASAANMAQVAGGVPAADPAKSAFALLASAVGLMPDKFAALVLAMDAASVSNLAILTMLETAAAKAASAADLAKALTDYETAMAAFVAQLNAAGLTGAIQAPAAIVIAGINA